MDILQKHTYQRNVTQFVNISKKKFLFMYLGFAFVYTLILGLQGFDMCDEGWCLTAYQQLFETPDSAEYNFLYYNAILVGAIWNYFFSSLGIWGFRLLSSICITLIAYFVYKILVVNVNRWCIFLGILLVLSHLQWVMVFHHNLLTALLCTIAVFFLYKALIELSSVKMILAGFVLGINIFSRIPNVSLLSLFLVFVPFYLCYRNLKITVRLLGFGILGVLVGIVIELLIMQSLGHWDLFIGNLTSGFLQISSKDSTHNMSNLLLRYIFDYRIIAKRIITLTSIPALFYVAAKITRNKYVKLFLVVLLVVVMIGNFGADVYSIYAFSYALLLAYLIVGTKQRDIVFLVTISIIILFFMPFGSDYAIGNMGKSCIWLAVPFSVGLFYKLLPMQAKYHLEKKVLLATLGIFVVCFVGRNLKQTISDGCYFDFGSRFNKTKLIEHPLVTTYTTESRCKVVDELLLSLKEFVSPGDYLLCWQSVPMVHYLTHTKPYLNCSWPMCYTISDLERHFLSAKNNIMVLPTVLCNKSAIGEWDKYNPYWDHEDAEDQWNFNSTRAKIFHRFLRDNEYVVVWENELFEILQPKENKINIQKVDGLFH